MNLIFNGKLLKEEDFSISFQNRAFAYADGVFETLTGTKKGIRFLKDHLERMREALSVLQIKRDDLFEPRKTEKEIIHLIESNQIKNSARIKITVWRKQGGLFSPEVHEGEYLISAMEYQQNLTPKKIVVIYTDVCKSFSPISKFKTLSSLNYVMAGIFKKEKKADDVILLDNYGNISECLSSNIFWIKGNYVFTPSLSCACIEGIMRKQLIKKLKEKKIILIEGAFSPQEVMKADFAFTSNIAGLIPILSVEEKKLNATNPLFDLLAEEFNKFPL